MTLSQGSFFLSDTRRGAVERVPAPSCHIPFLPLAARGATKENTSSAEARISSLLLSLKVQPYIRFFLA